MLVFGVGFIIISIPYLPAGFSATVMATIPLWVFIYNSIYDKEFNPHVFLAILLGFVGLSLLAFDKIETLPKSWLPILGLLIAAMSWSVASNFFCQGAVTVKVERQFPPPHFLCKDGLYFHAFYRSLYTFSNPFRA
jgi:drug/metabolite transporter (DMT)-like permease